MTFWGSTIGNSWAGAVPTTSVLVSRPVNSKPYNDSFPSCNLFRKSFCRGTSVRYAYPINFAMQSIQIGLPLTSSMKTLAGCIFSNAMRSEIQFTPCPDQLSRKPFAITRVSISSLVARRRQRTYGCMRIICIKYELFLTFVYLPVCWASLLF